ncbi:hypothetical protein [Frankia sp. AgPm24]|uniref:hypothetical protein n=1 Tax=Frankia sp. AgPm24 TaxID=631128 RepID=UPI002551E2D1|nr:hypothetical protein [Frankia sp. AgPm24]
MSGLIVIGSVKGSPGVTTASLGLAAGWPMRPGGAPVVAVEADPAGGDVLGWYELPAAGLVAWAAQARSGRSGLSGYVQRLPGGVEVVAAPVEAAAARGAVEVLARGGAVRAAADSVTVVVDVGRLDPSSPAGPLLGAADVLVVLARPVPAELARVVAGEAQLTGAGRRECVLLLVGEPRWPVERVAESVGMPVLGVLPHDAQGARRIAGRPGGRRATGHTPLARACREVAGRLAAELEARPVPLPATPLGVPVIPVGTAGSAAVSRTATVLVPGGAPSREGGGGGWVPSTSVRRDRGERR